MFVLIEYIYKNNFGRKANFHELVLIPRAQPLFTMMDPHCRVIKNVGRLQTQVNEDGGDSWERKRKFQGPHSSHLGGPSHQPQLDRTPKTLKLYLLPPIQWTPPKGMK